MNTPKLFFTAKPWLIEQGAETVLRGRAPSTSSAKIALIVFLAVVSSLFMLCLIAYAMRMKLNDWQAMPEPVILWFNTGLLLLASIVMQWSAFAAKRQNPQFRAGVLVGGLLTLGFLAGQLIAWQQAHDMGYGVAGNPANSFFYFLTGLHGLHLIGGLAVWGWVIGKIWQQPVSAATSQGLSALYWHYLLLVWLILFCLLLLT